MLKYQAPVLALALAPDNSSLIAATTDRTLTIRRRDLRHAAALAERERGAAAKAGARGVGGGIGGSGIGGIGGIGGDAVSGGGPRAVRTGTARYFNRGKTEGAGEGDVKVGGAFELVVVDVDVMMIMMMLVLPRFLAVCFLSLALWVGARSDTLVHSSAGRVRE